MDSLRLVPLGLLGAWCVNDAEEWFTFPATTRLVARLAPVWLPLPDAFRQGGFSVRHTRRGIAAMGAVVVSATVAGAVTESRSPLFRGGLLAFGVHGYIHLAGSVLTRKYTSGVVSAAAVVIPYWHWARRRVREAGLSDTDRSAVAVAACVWPILLAVHVVSARSLGDAAFGEPEL